MCAKTGIHWERFVEWAKKHSVEFRFPEDYEPWWKCWYDAVQSVTKEANHKDECLEVS